MIVHAVDVVGIGRAAGEEHRQRCTSATLCEHVTDLIFNQAHCVLFVPQQQQADRAEFARRFQPA